jgi:hypothetical protein
MDFHHDLGCRDLQAEISRKRCQAVPVGSIHF